MTVAHAGVCGPMTSTFSAKFSANASDVHVDVYNSTSCSGKVYTVRDEPVGGCIAGSYEYRYPAAQPKDTCLVWGHTQAGCPHAMSATVAQTAAKCKPALSSVDQSFAVAAGGGRWNITTFQYDAHVDDCTPMAFLPLLAEGVCTPLQGWYAPYAKLVCGQAGS